MDARERAARDRGADRATGSSARRTARPGCGCTCRVRSRYTTRVAGQPKGSMCPVSTRCAGRRRGCRRLSLSQSPELADEECVGVAVPRDRRGLPHPGTFAGSVRGGACARALTSGGARRGCTRPLPLRRRPPVYPGEHACAGAHRVHASAQRQPCRRRAERRRHRARTPAPPLQTLSPPPG